MKHLVKAMPVHKQYLLSAKKLLRQLKSDSAEVNPAWKVLDARKLAREAMNDQQSSSVPQPQCALLSTPVACRVLPHRRRHHLVLADTTNGALKDLGCMKIMGNVSTQPSVAPFLSELEHTCADIKDVNLSFNKLVVSA
eukprot:3911166-Rhodomonas_salina.2